MNEMTFSRTAAYVAWEVIEQPDQRIAFLDAVKQAYPSLEKLPVPLQNLMRRYEQKVEPQEPPR